MTLDHLVLTVADVQASARFYGALFGMTFSAADGRFVLAALFVMGLGIANVAPLIISAASRQRTMPSVPAVTAVTTIGYAGLTAGPALLGFIAEYASLVHAFAAIAVLLAVVGFGARRISPML